MKRIVKNAIEFILIVLLAVALYYQPSIWVTGSETVVDSNLSYYFEAASVTVNYKPPVYMTYDAQIYLNLLHEVLWFFGNHVAVVIYTHITLCVLSLVLFYLVIRRICGREIGLLLFAIFTCISYINKSILFTDARIIWILFTSILLALITGMVSLLLSIRSTKKKQEAVPSPVLQTIKTQALENDTSKPQEESVQAQNQIPNILPMPKRHVKKETINFKYNISEDQLHFDYSTSPEDDFDFGN